MPTMQPAPGTRQLRFVGDRIGFALSSGTGRAERDGWQARVRTNLGRGEMLRGEIIQSQTSGLPLAGASWRDLPMKADRDGWALDLPLTEAGFFQAKAYLIDPRGWQHWPEGSDAGIAVHPDRYRTGNIIYCAFARTFGATKTERTTRDEKREKTLAGLDENGYTVIPPSGKLRDLTAQLPHIIDTLGCRILHLLPVNPTPTTYARFGPFGSPYAALDLTAIDPALVVFDKHTTGVDQFCELTYAAHLTKARVFLDIVINHTGWGSILQENHPDWFLRQPDGTFASPGAWGTVWEDLIELKHSDARLWDKLAEMLLTWCRRGVDGFRCDAGYKVPVPAWQYIVARVQQEFPETLFLLEGLGGSWEATQALLTTGGMQWAYSELFQNYTGREVATYLDHSLQQSERVGLLVHYSETHDNERLAVRGRAWSLMRNQLCALASTGGGYGFTAGVEWLATEKISVHGCTGLAWGAKENLLPELAKLNGLLAEHPCFFDGARVTRLTPIDSAVCALRRESEDGRDWVLVLVNTDVTGKRSVILDREKVELKNWLDLLGQTPPELRADAQGALAIELAAGAAYCLSPSAKPSGLSGEAYRRSRAQAGWALKALGESLPLEAIPNYPWLSLAALVEESPARCLAALPNLETELLRTEKGLAPPALAQYSRVVRWNRADGRRITPVPPDHWLLIEDTEAFRATLELRDGQGERRLESIPTGAGHVACFPPRKGAADAELRLERYAVEQPEARGSIRFLGAEPAPDTAAIRPTDIVLLTNGRGGMARLCVDLGRVNSKYDCVLGANLHPTLPVDRHIFAKRLRAWVNADGFISALNFQNLASFQPGPPAVWDFVANAGDGRTVEIQMTAEMAEGLNAVRFVFSRPTAEKAAGKQLPSEADVRITARIDIEDRNFHTETKRNGGAEYHFATHTHPLDKAAGFEFTPASDRQLRVVSNEGRFHPSPEWSDNIANPVEQSRGQVGSADAFSPGWFELPLKKGGTTWLTLSAESPQAVWEKPDLNTPSQPSQAIISGPDAFSERLRRAARAFVVRRESGKTVIAGYPWFLDWGRDTFICARGLLAAGMVDEVEQILITFARFEATGTLPNTIHGGDASNRDTSDAPLWFGIVCEEIADIQGKDFYARQAGQGNRTIADTLASIAANYARGTPNQIRMDPASGLIWSPSHFTWMDTNHPACTPREGYPVEIQALWIRLLRQLERIGQPAPGPGWGELAAQASASLDKYYWRETAGYYADVLQARPGQPASEAVVDDALRSNSLFLVSLELAKGSRAQRSTEAALRHLVVPGALRSLAPLPTAVPLPNRGNEGQLLNDPSFPYWGRYEGDEDTRRKPAYHNGTAWTWTFPVFCEALARAWDFSPTALAAAKSYLGSIDRLLNEGCLGQIPEILDGNAPHRQRGCDAQAWGVTEALRVWKLLRDKESGG